jgi:hypothetical protein
MFLPFELIVSFGLGTYGTSASRSETIFFIDNNVCSRAIVHAEVVVVSLDGSQREEQPVGNNLVAEATIDQSIVEAVSCIEAVPHGWRAATLEHAAASG